jgi:glycosyltransferase involved in cell wall biosynthesis
MMGGLVSIDPHEGERPRRAAVAALRVGASRAEGTAPIDRAYLLVMAIPYYRDDDGSVWLERLWHRDFVRHLSYLRNLTLAAPAYRRADARGLDLVRVEIPAGGALRFVALPKQESALSAVTALPGTASALWRAIASTDIVHSGILGWPYPLGWLANPMALLRGKPLMIVVESATWRPTGAKEDSRWRRRLRAVVTEALARWSVNHASISFFTQPSYRQSLLTRDGRPGFVLPASWIDEDDLLDEAAAARSWQTKQAAGRRARMLFAGRLIPEKGVEILLQAVELLRQDGCEVDIDIIGEGGLRERCLTAASAAGRPRVRLLDPLPYGPAFFELLRDYHAVLVPNLGDEQPRIVFDAFSQAVPVIGADTDGLRPHVLPGRTGWLFGRGDAHALSRRIAEAASSRPALQRLGLSALENAGTFTHQRMHGERRRFLAEQLGF